MPRRKDRKADCRGDAKATGDGRWWNAFLIPHEDRFFICNEQGELIIAELSPAGYKEFSRAKLVEPTRDSDAPERMTIWSHPAFAMQSVFARNDKEIVHVDLAARNDGLRLPMPELPEVETMVRGIRPSVEGKRIVEFRRAPVPVPGDPAAGPLWRRSNAVAKEKRSWPSAGGRRKSSSTCRAASRSSSNRG